MTYIRITIFSDDDTYSRNISASPKTQYNIALTNISTINYVKFKCKTLEMSTCSHTDAMRDTNVERS